MTKSLKLFANCIPVRGNQRGIICDLQRNEWHLVPSSLIDLFDTRGVMRTDTSEFDDESQEALEYYRSFLLEKELAFYCDAAEIELYPGLSMRWDFPSVISNCILDFDGNNELALSVIVQQLSDLNCHYIQMRFFVEIDFEKLINLIAVVNLSTIKAIDFVLKENATTGFYDRLENIVQQNRKIRSVVIHDAIDNRFVAQASNAFGSIVSVRESINELHCGIIHHSYFSMNVETFTESQHHNTCLNRKISIDAEGNIKNCPSMSESFGNIQDTTLKEAVEKPGFKKYWDITKDQITVCKDCEFRHICTDCRAYLENPEDDYSKPLKCGYNPYTCEWEEWSTHPLKQKAIEYYGMQELVRK
ncbi:grasp-with-spasm system SPASM domain peptide maturase [Taibaiella soli]|uniref:Grasp-with-spasm system SPASM domain peptide maturase n=1 Tax=Taibaiella soli TaxID=1649169 RepID=A0A2W2AEW4_9BACT|nr:grasp-with-spasm system SPASM domain peptide maturase [Taibaiella soli]PZF73831.1 grasp-with-spasm system SPASM domain peptide maturase [Taibaiella soli]